MHTLTEITKHLIERIQKKPDKHAIYEQENGLIIAIKTLDNFRLSVGVGRRNVTPTINDLPMVIQSLQSHYPGVRFAATTAEQKNNIIWHFTTYSPRKELI